jgi:hypothetical protein
MTIVLPAGAETELLEKDTGSGGFQSLLKKLRERYNPLTKELALDDDDIERINRYANGYGNGGWEERLKKIFAGTTGIL